MKASKKETDIQTLLRLVREGDQEAFSRLMALYEPLIRAEVASHTVGVDTFHAEDFRQVALLALYRAALGFDLSQCEVEFGLYAKICIANALASQLRVLRRHSEVSVADVLLGEGDHGEGDPARRVMEEEAAQILHTRIRKLLSPFENRVWNLYTAGLPAKEIGRVLGKDIHSIENAVYRIRRKLRLALGGAD